MERTYCPWCVGKEESLKRQGAGESGGICERHLRELLGEERYDQYRKQHAEGQALPTGDERKENQP
ncbi:hypothetical protein FJZ40_00260 [Candidatus Shapirobacteria bacterium]|nr:hypothetical protein [Candidatus Shapirobacteria bacterium]